MTSKLISYPRAFLETILQELGMQQIELSKRTGISAKTINSILKGSAPISPETALSFEMVLGKSAKDLLAMEAKYQLRKVNALQEESLTQELSFLDQINYREIAKAGWVKKESNKIEKLKRLYEFFGVSSFNQLSPVWSQLEVNYRTSTVYKKKHFNIMAWLRQGEIEAQKIACSPFSLKSFKEALFECRRLTTQSFEECHIQIQELCRKAGVAVIYVKELPGVATSGAAHWVDKDKAIIQLSLRGKADDKFWFNFFHEAGHIVLHGRKEQFIDNNGKGQSTAKDEDAETPYETVENKLKEAEADAFAANLLIPKKELDKFVDKNTFDRDSIVSFAHEQGIAPGIVVGQLQNKGHIGWSSSVGRLKRRYEFPDNFANLVVDDI
ncbi:HigA family addiction module antitoxin [Psychrosphaera sp. 1_MG-2023]|uniref:HigA family addiction module antitoxin n=1 Tax=Psychrosphaera sp. 1_MG-2023 TaxID=3062643 RepID=UPI0026E404AD|nr:HigA family addiction module antitoxin [Psychrosphaera sp. 1_MG-2023]MDO6719712.1 HigA family addiction module antitoxin [Psychrosphaera sp. 1_MG-2023]